MGQCVKIRAIHFRSAHFLRVLYIKKTYPYKTSVPKSNPFFFFFSQIDGQNELKAIEKEKMVVALAPKEASKCHREDLAKAFYVRTVCL